MIEMKQSLITLGSVLVAFNWPAAMAQVPETPVKATNWKTVSNPFRKVASVTTTNVGKVTFYKSVKAGMVRA
ncbi:MAG: hypothetical protein ACRD3W_10115, partial [Terriglobales bacterium]